jgi:hypothetical protein
MRLSGPTILSESSSAPATTSGDLLMCPLGNKAETKTMLPVIEAFMGNPDLPDVTVVADAGMISEAEPEGD